MKLWQKIFIVIIFVAAAVLQLFCALNDSITADEVVHLTAGYLHVSKGDYTYNFEHPPLANDLSGVFIKAFVHPKLPSESTSNTEQYQYGGKFLFETGNNFRTLAFWGRLPIILIFLATLYLIFIFSRKLWGVNGALLATFLAAFCPNLLAHGHLATTDMMVTFAFLLNFYLLWLFLEKPTWKKSALLGGAIGILLLSKFSALIGLPLDLIILIIALIWRKDKSYRLTTLKFMSAIIISLIILYLVYIFSGRNDWDELFSQTSFIKWLLWPAKKYYDGLHFVQLHDQLGHLAYLNGQFSQTGWWNYFPWAFVYKTPLPTIILLALALPAALFLEKRREVILFVLIPSGAFFGFSLFSHIDIGLRHILPIYPFIYILIGGLVVLKNKISQIIIIILVLATLFLSARAFPDFLAFFNWYGLENNLPKISDSNFDWNQNVYRLESHLKEQNISQVYFECYNNYFAKISGIQVLPPPTQPTPGVIVLCANQYLQDRALKPEFNWFIKAPATERFRTLYFWSEK